MAIKNYPHYFKVLILKSALPRSAMVVSWLEELRSALPRSALPSSYFEEPT